MDQTAEPAYPTDADVDDVLADFDGDRRKAIAALLHDLDMLAKGYEASVSRGFVRAVAAALVT